MPITYKITMFDGTCNHVLRKRKIKAHGAIDLMIYQKKPLKAFASILLNIFDKILGKFRKKTPKKVLSKLNSLYL